MSNKGEDMKRSIAFLFAIMISSWGWAQTVKIDGSSTVFPITEGIAEEFQKANRKIRATVGISGTGGGFKKFCRGEIDIANASRPILAAEIEACNKAGIRYYEFPVAFDALTVVVHSKNNFVKQLSVEELKRMWEPAAQGKVMNWNQIDSKFPNRPLRLFGAGTDSGTFDYFTEAIVGKSKSSRGDFTASEDDNVLVQGISRNQDAIGYFGFAYYAENQDKLKAVPILNRAGKAVSPSMETVMDGSYNPLSRPIFIYVSERSLDRAEVQEFIKFYMANVAKISREVKYVPLPEKAYQANLQHIQKKRVGTIFGGHNEVGMTIEELIKREAR
jgi:phosphate transport system substrate-binding protein